MYINNYKLLLLNNTTELFFYKKTDELKKWVKILANQKKNVLLYSQEYSKVCFCMTKTQFAQVKLTLKNHHRLDFYSKFHVNSNFVFFHFD